MKTVRRVNCVLTSIYTVDFWRMVVLVFDSGNELVIHAMKARKQLLNLLP